MHKLNRTISMGLVIGMVVVTIGVTAFGAIKLADSLADNKGSKNCGAGVHAEQIVVIKDDAISPNRIEAPRCDRLKVINKDNRGRLMAFGQHDRHVPYDGITERFLLKDESFSVSLGKSGTFILHDHNDEEVELVFKVN